MPCLTGFSELPLQGRLITTVLEEVELIGVFLKAVGNGAKIHPGSVLPLN